MNRSDAPSRTNTPRSHFASFDRQRNLRQARLSNVANVVELLENGATALAAADVTSGQDGGHSSSGGHCQLEASAVEASAGTVRRMPDGVIRYPRYRFPPAIISHAVWLDYRFTLSFRDVEDLLALRGITVSYKTVRRWCQTFGLAYARRLRRHRGPVGDTLASRRVVRNHRPPAPLFVACSKSRRGRHRHPAPTPPGSPRRGAVLSRIAEGQRPSAAPRRHQWPRQLPGRPSRRHAVGRARHHTLRQRPSQVTHQPTRQREVQMRRFKSVAQAQRFLSSTV